jgi:hypothetical protein
VTHPGSEHSMHGPASSVLHIAHSSCHRLPFIFFTRSIGCIRDTFEIHGSGIHIAQTKWHHRPSSVGFRAPPRTGHRQHCPEPTPQPGTTCAGGAATTVDDAAAAADFGELASSLVGELSEPSVADCVRTRALPSGLALALAAAPPSTLLGLEVAAGIACCSSCSTSSSQCVQNHGRPPTAARK